VTAAIDPAAITQLPLLLLLLLNNALTYTPVGGRVAFALCQGNAAAGVAVTDTGSGIDPADLARIVERFAAVRPIGYRDPSA